MMPRRLGPAAGLVLALAVAACSDSPTSANEAAELAPSEAIYADTATALSAERRQAPTLAVLFAAAVGKVRAESGPEAVHALTATLRRLHQEAQAAWNAGDRRTAARRLEEARLEMARIVIRVTGPHVVPTVINTGRTGLEALGERIRAAEAAGQDVSRLRQTARTVYRLLTAARRSAEAGRPAVALLQGATAVDALRRLDTPQH